MEMKGLISITQHYNSPASHIHSGPFDRWTKTVDSVWGREGGCTNRWKVAELQTDQSCTGQETRKGMNRIVIIAVMVLLMFLFQYICIFIVYPRILVVFSASLLVIMSFCSCSFTFVQCYLTYFMVILQRFVPQTLCAPRIANIKLFYLI